MNQKRISFLLILAGAIAGTAILALSAFYAPAGADAALRIYADVRGIYGLSRMGLIGVWAVSALFGLALISYFRICVRIGKGQSFCQGNVRGLLHIAAYLTVCAVLWLGAIFAPSFFFHILIGPLWVIFLLFSMANAAMAMLALGLSRLLSQAVEIQRENELTV